MGGSDGAGEVVEVGPKVTRFRKGDRVVTLFNQGHQFGPVDQISVTTGLGGAQDGTLRQYGVFNENGLVRAPANLPFEEAATLTCAGLTSWNALYGLKPLKPGEFVLVQGTGGVSIFALQVRQKETLVLKPNERKSRAMERWEANTDYRNDTTQHWK